MTNELVKGKLITFAAIAAIVTSAWWAREFAPTLEVPRWFVVPVALLLVSYLYLGYRGFRWIVGVVLVTVGGAAIYQLVASSSFAGIRQVGLSLLVVATLVLGPSLGLSPAVGSYLEYRRSRRPESAASVLVAVWIVILAIAAVWVWVRAGVQVF